MIDISDPTLCRACGDRMRLVGPSTYRCRMCGQLLIVRVEAPRP